MHARRVLALPRPRRSGPEGLVALRLDPAARLRLARLIAHLASPGGAGNCHYTY